MNASRYAKSQNISLFCRNADGEIVIVSKVAVRGARHQGQGPAPCSP
jgi:hypothetical protein